MNVITGHYDDIRETFKRSMDALDLRTHKAKLCKNVIQKVLTLSLLEEYDSFATETESPLKDKVLADLEKNFNYPNDSVDIDDIL